MRYVIYALEGCPFSKAALKLLNDHKLPYRLIKVDASTKDQVKRQNGLTTFPQIYYEIGGYSDLQNMFNPKLNTGH
jgi:glutaredoxin